MKELGQQGLARERVEKDKALFGGREVMDKTLAVIGLGHIGAATARDSSSAFGMKIVGCEYWYFEKHRSCSDWLR